MREKNVETAWVFRRDHLAFRRLSSFNLSGRCLLRWHLNWVLLKEGTFAESDLHMSHFGHVRCTHTDFSRAHMSGIRLRSVTFKGCNLGGADFTCAYLRSCSFRECDLTCVDFSGAYLADVTFKRCDLSQADFSGADLVGSLFSRCSLRSIHLENAYATAVDVRPSCSNCDESLAWLRPKRSTLFTRARGKMLAWRLLPRPPWRQKQVPVGAAFLGRTRIGGRRRGGTCNVLLLEDATTGRQAPFIAKGLRHGPKVIEDVEAHFKEECLRHLRLAEAQEFGRVHGIVEYATRPYLIMDRYAPLNLGAEERAESDLIEIIYLLASAARKVAGLCGEDALLDIKPNHVMREEETGRLKFVDLGPGVLPTLFTGSGRPLVQKGCIWLIGYCSLGVWLGRNQLRWQKKLRLRSSSFGGTILHGPGIADGSLPPGLDRAADVLQRCMMLKGEYTSLDDLVRDLEAGWPRLEPVPDQTLSADDWANLGAGALQLRSFEEARELLLRALDRHASHAGALANLALCDMALWLLRGGEPPDLGERQVGGRDSHALRRHRIVLAVCLGSPPESDLLSDLPPLDRAGLSVAAGEFKLAWDLVRQVLDGDARESRLLHVGALAAWGLRDFSSSRSYLERYLQRSPRSAEARRDLKDLLEGVAFEPSRLFRLQRRAPALAPLPWHLCRIELSGELKGYFG